jgi:DNA-binding MarR family transcriptional regulator
MIGSRMTISQVTERSALLRRLEEVQASFERRAVSTMAEPLLSTPLTMQQLKVLTLVAAERGQAAGHDLAETLHVSVATMSGLVDRLVEHGMVQRSDDPTDRRVRRLSVSDAGAATLRSLLSNQNTMPTAVLERLADDDLRALVQGLAAVDRVLEELSLG